MILITIRMTLFCSRVPLSHDSVWQVSLHAQYQDPDTEAAKSIIIHFIISPVFFLLCQNVFREKGLVQASSTNK